MSADGTYLIYDYFHRNAQVCISTDCVTAELEPGGFAWHQILPFERESVFLGLAEKYVGFSAVEDMWITKEGMTGILREQGPTGFACIRRPDKVFCNGVDVTDLLVKENGSDPVGIYTIVLNTKSGRTVLEVHFAK